MFENTVYQSGVDLARVDPELSPAARRGLAMLNEDDGRMLEDDDIASGIGCSMHTWLVNRKRLTELGYLAPGEYNGNATLEPVLVPLLRLRQLEFFHDLRGCFSYVNGQNAPLLLREPANAMSFLFRTGQLFQVGSLGGMTAVRFICAVYDALKEGESVRLFLYGRDFDRFAGALNGEPREKLGMRPFAGVAFTDQRFFVFHEHSNTSASQRGAYTLKVGDHAELGEVVLKKIATTVPPLYSETLCSVSDSGHLELAALELQNLPSFGDLLRAADIPFTVAEDQ